MFRKTLLVIVAGSIAMLSAGCPTAPDGASDDFLPDDPLPPQAAALNVTATATVLQANLIGLLNPQFDNIAILTGAAANTTATIQSVSWSVSVVTADSASALAFGTERDTAEPTATGAVVAIIATRAPSTLEGPVEHDVSAVAQLSDGTQVSATVRIIVRPDPIISGDSTVLTLSPTADPPVGTNSLGRIVLDANVTGQVGSVFFEWALLGDAPEGLLLPAALQGPDLSQITIEVAAGQQVSGVFPFRVTATDAGGNRTTAVLNVFIGIVDLMLDVRPLRVEVGALATITVETLRAGGLADLTTGTDDAFLYEWRLVNAAGLEVDPAGLDISPPDGPGNFYDDNLLNWTIAEVPRGSYRLVGTVTDRSGATASDSAYIPISNTLDVTVASRRDRVPVGEPINLRTVRVGGEAPFSYSWLVLDQNNSNVTAAATFAPGNPSSQSAAAVNYVVTGLGAGAYRFFLTVTDGAGDSSVAATTVAVGDVLSLDVRASAHIVAPGGNATLSLLPNGGLPPYTFTFANGGGSGGGAPTFNPTSPIAANGATNTVWTAPGAAFSGSYSVNVTVTDALGNTANDSIWLIVEPANVLSLDARADDHIIAPNGNTTLRFVPNGGVAPYTFTFVNGPGTGGGMPTFNPTSPINSNGTATTTWTAPAAAFSGSYSVNVTVTDALGKSATDSIWLIVEPNDTLTLDVRADEHILAPGATTTLRFVPNGGVSPYTFTFANGPGTGGGTPTFNPDSPINAAGTATTDWTAPGAAFAGSYSVDVTVTDTLGNTAIDSIWLIVESAPGTGLALDVRPRMLQIGVPTVATMVPDLLLTERSNGTADFTYTISVLDPDGNTDAGNFGFVFDPVSGSVNNNANIGWDVTIPANPTPGTYNFVFTVTDADANSFVASAPVLIANGLTADLHLFTNVLAEGMPMPLESRVTGGFAVYTHVLSALDSNDDAPANAFHDGVGGGNPLTLTGTTAIESAVFFPQEGVGAYRITTTITDSSLNTAARTGNVLVTGDHNLVIRDALLNPIAAQTILNNDGIVTGGLVALPASGVPLVLNVDLPHARNLEIVVANADPALVFNSVLVSGVNARGVAIEEALSGADLLDLAAGNQVALQFPFARVNSVEFDYANEGGTEEVEIGVGERFGLSGKLPTASDDAARQAIHLVAFGTGGTLESAASIAQATFLDVNDFTVSSADEDPPGTPTADQQFFVFPAGSAPDGDRDYLIQFGPVP